MNNLHARRAFYSLAFLVGLVVLGALALCAAVLLRESGLFRHLDRALTLALTWTPENADPPGWVEPSPEFLRELRGWCATTDGVPDRVLSDDEYDIYCAWMARFAPGQFVKRVPDDFPLPADQAGASPSSS